MGRVASIGTKQISANFLTRHDPWEIVSLGAVLVTILIITIQLVVILGVSVLPGGLNADSYDIGAKHYVDIFADSFTYHVLLNTVGFACVTLVVSIAFGLPIAWLVARTDLPGKAIVATTMTAGLLIPGFTPAMGWLFLLHPRIGLFNAWMVEVFGPGAPILDITSIAGMGFVQGLSLVPVAFIMTVAVFRSMNPALEEAAAMSGSNALSTFLHITLRLAWPGILAASIFIFSIGFATLDVPAIIGWSNRVYTYSTYLLSLINGSGGMPEYGGVAALSAPMLIWAAILTWLYARVQKRSKSYEVISGKSYRPRIVELGSGKILAWGVVGIYIALSIGLPMLVLVWAAVLPSVLIPSAEAFALLTLDNFAKIDWSITLTALSNTVVLAALTATVVTFLSCAFSWTVLRSKVKGRSVVELFAFLPHVVPNTLFAVAVMLVGLFVIDKFAPIYGTIWILLLALVTVRISYGTRMTNGALIQIHRELEESAQMAGASLSGVIRYILVPLMAPTLLFTWLWTALLTAREMTVIMFLSTSGNVTLPYLIWGTLAGQPGVAAAISLFMIAVLVPFVFAFAVAMNRKRMLSY